MKSAPKVSVLMPVYNAEEFLYKSVSSILNQTFSDFELLILDDASTDNSLQIMQKYEQQDARIKILQNKKNNGEGYCRAKLVKQAKAPLIAWMDADDISLKERLKMQLDFLEKNTAVDVVGCRIKIFGGKKDRLSSVFVSDKSIKSAMLLINPIVGATTMVRIASQKKPYDISIRVSPDYLYWIDNIANFRYYNLPQVLYEYRLNPHGITASEKTPYEKHFLTMQKYLSQFEIDLTKNDFLVLRGQKKPLYLTDIKASLWIIKKLLAIKNFYGYPKIDKKSLLKIYAKYFIKGLVYNKR